MKSGFTLSLLLPGFCFLYLNTNAQSGTWIWMSGSNISNNLGTYGTQGVASVNNTPPAMYNSSQWTDKNGNFWVFGGEDHNYNEYNDLWEYKPQNNTWTWVKGPGTTNNPGVNGTLGVPSINNNPSARKWGCGNWTDSVGDLWLFGGEAINSEANDLWRYHIATNEWTWMGGSTNGGTFNYGTLYQPSANSLPPGRYELNAAWIDANNNFWFIGGVRTGYMNDLWRYSTSTAQWAWMGGSQQSGAADVYGAFGVESPTNLPGGRASYAHWISGQYLYLCGGFDETNGYEYHNDVWRFNTLNNNWAWVGGDMGSVPTGNYNDLCDTANGNMPRGRMEHRAAQLNGCNPTLLIWGGYSDVGNYNTLNDLWSFDLTSAKWKWLSGSASIDPVANYGVKGVGAPANIPAGSGGPCLWSDNQGQLWLMGGWQYNGGSSNALWKYIPDNSCIGADTASSNLSYTLSSTSICVGDPALISFFNDTGVTITPFVNVTWLDSAHAVLKPDTSTTYRVSGYSPCGSVAFASFTLLVKPDTASFSSGQSSICRGDSSLLNFTGYASVSITPLGGVSWLDSVHAYLKPDTTTLFNIAATSYCGTITTATYLVHVSADTLAFSTSKTSICRGDSVVLTFTADSAVSISPTAYVYWSDSQHAILSPDSSTLFTITGYTACGLYTTHFSLPVVTDTVPISADKEIMCPGDTARICAPAGLPAYSWNTGNTTACINATAAGNYYVSVTESDNCHATSNHLGIAVYQPSPVLTNVKGDTLQGFDAVTYQWLLNGAPINGASDSIYLAKTNGTYTLQVTDSNGCTSTSNPIVITSISNAFSDNSITIFPNPTSTGWQLDVNDAWIGSTTEIYDATGRVVYKSQISNIHSLIEIPGLASGVYELRVTQQGYEVVRKLVKM